MIKVIKIFWYTLLIYMLSGYLMELTVYNNCADKGQWNGVFHTETLKCRVEITE